MKKKVKIYTATNSFELAEILGLDPEDAIEFEFRAILTKKIFDIVKAQKLTHAEVARKSKASRTRVTAIMNGHARGISTDMLLRILYSLGYSAQVSFVKNKRLVA